MRLAWHNIAYDRIRFAVTVLCITLAVFLIVFQCMLVGFLRAASKIIDSTCRAVARGRTAVTDSKDFSEI